ncbi:pyruvate dehydrogenase E2 component (dihydrolipoamide acetyltransferase) [Advenella incenata]|jgi:pyruvate dehydrogenase E2 component (dihydrolipoamide acetyltransferase)|uniref:Acetyltransferase component of pyruvate dehydrogenase complex n=1 Tax=Advenella incenata TaxID=267800 RepID=A0A4Q7VUD3_9BURK|nr:dihydrolipoyllysine-residue acetyltransferase [Advenella incenata]RZU00247.1 pyruvate dehydrogenase E2 component (dihydrolipoamide acetyltransferase) [Advenella incenata]
MSNVIEIKVPDIGDFSEVEVIELLVAPGDTVKEEQSLITVESDKASMEIPSSASGVVKEISVKVGDKVAQGKVILTLEAEQAAAADNGKPAAGNAADDAAKPADKEQPAEQQEATQPAGTDSGSATLEVTVPDIGDFSEVEVIEVLVAPGDKVKQEQSLITVESDKASMEIPSSDDGEVEAVLVKVGDKVAKGTAIVKLKSGGGAAKAAAVPAETKNKPADSNADKAQGEPATAAKAPAPQASGAAQQRVSPTAAFGSAVSARSLPHASPSVRKFARELGVDLTQITGSGEKQRITQDDVRKFVKAALSVATSTSSTTTSSQVGGGGLSVLDWPNIDFSKFGPIESKPLSRIKKISGANLHRNWVMIPHVTNNEQADITELEAFRVAMNKEYEKAGVKFTMLAFLIKAVVSALQKFPEFNASLSGDNLVLKQYYHVGFAADTPNGLVVPVIRDADKKAVSQIAKEMTELAKLARDGKLSPAQMQGGCFSISSLGGIGGTSFTPIINAPEVAILGVSKSAMQPVWNGKEFAPRLMLPLSLSYDHRVIDGAAAARFNAYLAAVLADFRRVLI